jgi:hypothetical protein
VHLAVHTERHAGGSPHGGPRGDPGACGSRRGSLTGLRRRDLRRSALRGALGTRSRLDVTSGHSQRRNTLVVASGPCGWWRDTGHRESWCIRGEMTGCRPRRRRRARRSDRLLHVDRAASARDIERVRRTTADERDLARCQRYLRDRSAVVQSRTADGFTLVEGRDPSNVPVVLSYSGPEQAARHQIMLRIYEW